MVARLIEGWESSTSTAHYLGKWSAFGGGTLAIGPTHGRFGNGLGHTGGTGGHCQRVFDNQATWVLGFAFRPEGIAASTISLCALLDTATVHCGLGMAADTGVLFAWRNTTGTVLGTASAGVTAGAWHYLEVKATINDTAGVFVVRLNGTVVLNLSSVDTRNAGNASANTVRIGYNSAYTYDLAYDDIYIFDATGTANTDFAGDCTVSQVLPTGAGATTAWTPSAGANYQCVDEVPPTADTDYVSSATAGQTDTYACGDLSVTGTVKAVQATALARKDDAGSRSIALVARPGSTDRVGSTQAVSDGYAGYAQVWDTNPDTSAGWTVADLNSSQFGQRLIA